MTNENTLVQEPKEGDFHPSAIFVRNMEGKLLRVTTSNGKEVLWQPGMAIPNATDAIRDMTPEFPKLENPQDSDIMPNATTVPNQAPKQAAQPRKARQHRSLVTPAMIQTMRRLRQEGQGPAEIGRAVGVATSTVERYAPSLRRAGANGPAEHSDPVPRTMPDDTAAIPSCAADFPARNKRELPSGTIQAIQLVLSAAGRTGILSQDPITRAHFEGYQCGIETGLAIVCGALNVDLTFLQEEESDVN